MINHTIIKNQIWSDDVLPLVTIQTVSYLHEKFLNDYFEGILSQKTNFRVEVVIYDDASQDETKKIIKEYQEKYPKLIKAIISPENLYSKFGFEPIRKLINDQTEGKYIALCESDDYWLNPFKLQKQIDFLEKNDDFSMCVHNAIVKYHDTNFKSHNFNDIRFDCELELKDIIEWKIPTASIVYRKSILQHLSWGSRFYCGDFIIALTAFMNGRLYYFSDTSSVYRKILKGNSMSSILNNQSEFINEEHFSILNLFNEKTKGKYSVQLSEYINKINYYKKFYLSRKKNKYFSYILFPKVFFVGLWKRILNFINIIAKFEN